MPDEKPRPSYAMRLVIDGKERFVSYEELALSNNLAQEALVRLLVRKKIIKADELLEEINTVKGERYRPRAWRPITLMSEELARLTTGKDAEDPGRELLRWRYHPVREGGGRLVAVLAFLTGMPILLGWLYGPFFVILSLVILGGSLGTFFLPTEYVVYSGGLETRFIGVTRRFAWDQFRSYYPDRNGVLLSPFPAPSRLENFRGLFVRFNGNRDDVLAIVRERVPLPLKKRDEAIMNFGEWFKTRKSVDQPAQSEADLAQKQAEAEIMRRLAAKVVEWQMTVPAILFLESVKPLNYIGAQAMVFFEPFVQSLFNLKDYDTLRIMMEKRENVEVLLLKIEELDAEALRNEKDAKAARRAARGRKRWWWPFGSKPRSPDTPHDPGSPPVP